MFFRRKSIVSNKDDFKIISFYNQLNTNKIATNIVVKIELVYNVENSTQIMIMVTERYKTAGQIGKGRSRSLGFNHCRVMLPSFYHLFEPSLFPVQNRCIKFPTSRHTWT